MPVEQKANWPEAVSDGLTLPCAFCNIVPKFDYRVSDDFWQAVVPAGLQLGVVCLPCLDDLAVTAGHDDLEEALVEVQFTGYGKTIILKPEWTHRYEAKP